MNKRSKQEVLFPESCRRCDCSNKDFAEWTCEGSLKLQSRSRRWRDARPLPRRCVCQYAVERSAQTDNKGGTAEVEFQELLSLYKWKTYTRTKALFACYKEGVHVRKRIILCSHKEWFFTGRISSLHTTEMQRSVIEVCKDARPV